ncbi:hypothetical protein FKP32DRAFT_1753775 [Trametes sanguinea]|nr:hypothetical protein FKP32DRAFT_1753775 [Trametes sanguinea]
MSISSTLLGSSDVPGHTQAVKDGWANELKNRLVLYPGQREEFINELLPCATPFPDNDDPTTLRDAFSEYKPVVGQEVASYPSLIAGMMDLVSTFPNQKRLDVVDTSGIDFSFPFDGFKDHHQKTSPDLSISFPGETVTPGDWQTVSMVVEVKSSETQDPFPKNDDASAHVSTVAQLAKNARNLLLAHGFLSTFLIGVYGRTLRLARFDHAFAVVSPPISLNDNGAGLLKKFFWHFVHPIVGHRVVGSDPTVMPLSADDCEWVRSQLSDLKPRNWKAHVGELAKGRRMEVYDQRTGRCVPYLAYHLVDVNGRLFSRATTIWRVIEDTRVWKDGKLVPDPTCTRQVKPRILKEAWRQLVRTAETEVYDRLESTIPEDEMFGLARMECGGDIGSLELKWWKRTRNGTLPDPVDDASADDAPSASSPSSPPAEPPLPFCSTGRSSIPANGFRAPTPNHVPPFAFPLPYPQHQTYSARLHGIASLHCERSHVRIVIEDVGRPLSEFSSSREMVAAMRDAIEGHRIAWEKAKVLHRDVSLGNILIADDPSEGSHRGFLHDFDYSSMEATGADSQDNMFLLLEDDEEILPEDIARFKERTGTYYFIAIALLDSDVVGFHEACHDIESYYWVLLWVVLRHTKCHRNANEDGESLCKTLFKPDDDETAVSAKLRWLQRKELTVLGNKPLTTLVERFNRLVAVSRPPNRYSSDPTIPLTHRAVLEAFDEALAMEGWPENDWKACTLMQVPRTGIAPTPILHDIVPGYPIHSEGRALRSNTHSNAKPAPALPTVPVASGSGSLAPVQRSGTKRANADDAPAEPSGATHSLKRPKANNMAPPPAPGSEQAAAGPSEAKTSGGRVRRSGSRAAPALTRQPTRRSSRIEAQKERNASRSDPAR